MVSIDIRVLNFYQVLNHSVSWHQIFIKELHHGVINLSSEVLESHKLRHVNLHHDPPEFLEDQLDALKTRGLEPFDLLLAKDFKGYFRNKQIWLKARSIPNGCLYVFIRQSIERIYSSD